MTLGGRETRVAGRCGVMLRAPVTAIVLVLGLSVAGCGAVYEGPQGMERMLQPSAESRTNQALAAMARGEYGKAEQALAMALDADANDPYALFAAGALYMNTGRPQVARDAFERIIALQPRGTLSSGPWTELRQSTLVDLAREALGRMPADGAMLSPSTPLGLEPSATVLRTAEGRSVMVLPGTPEPLDSAAQRFEVLRVLRDQDLITGDEYGRRRAANLGALLPLTQKPPAPGLDRPVAQPMQVVDRLRQLRAAYESRAITGREHEAERETILDGILPADPETRAIPEPPPEGVVQAAAAVGRLERLRKEGLIGDAEYRRERAAIEKALSGGATAATPKPTQPAKKAPGPKKDDAKAKPTPLVPPPAAEGGIQNPAATLQTGRTPMQVVPNPPDFQNPDAAGSAGPGSGGIAAIHLASFKTQEQAIQGWEDLKKKFPALDKMQPKITTITLPDKGTFFRLNAGPVGTREQAQKLCESLGDQYCEPVFLGG